MGVLEIQLTRGQHGEHQDRGTPNPPYRPVTRWGGDRSRIIEASVMRSGKVTGFDGVTNGQVKSVGHFPVSTIIRVSPIWQLIECNKAIIHLGKHDFPTLTLEAGD